MLSILVGRLCIASASAPVRRLRHGDAVAWVSGDVNVRGLTDDSLEPSSQTPEVTFVCTRPVRAACRLP